jgi:hypothetical protein
MVSRRHSRSSSGRGWPWCGRGVGAALQVGSRILAKSAPPAAEPAKRADGGHMPVPGRPRPPASRSGHRDGDRLHAELGQRPVAAELMHQPGEGLVIAMACRPRQARPGEERCGGLAEGLVGGCEGTTCPTTLGAPWEMWQGMRCLATVADRQDSKVTTGVRPWMWQGWAICCHRGDGGQRLSRPRTVNSARPSNTGPRRPTAMRIV